MAKGQHFLVKLNEIVFTIDKVTFNMKLSITHINIVNNP